MPNWGNLRWETPEFINNNIMTSKKIWELADELIQEPESVHYVATEDALCVTN